MQRQLPADPFGIGPNGEPRYLEDMRAAQAVNATFVRRHLRNETARAVNNMHIRRRARSACGDRQHRPRVRTSAKANAPPGADDPGGDDPPDDLDRDHPAGVIA